MFAQREGVESRATEASSPGDGRCASGTVTLREIKEEERWEGKGSCGYRGYPVSQLLFSLSPPSADYGRGRNWIGHVDTSCPKRRTISGGQGRGGEQSSLGPAGPTWSVQDRSNVLAAAEEDDIEIAGGRGWERADDDDASMQIAVPLVPLARSFCIPGGAYGMGGRQ